MGAFYTYLLKKDIGFLFLSFISRIESKRRAFILVHNALLSYLFSIIAFAFSKATLILGQIFSFPSSSLNPDFSRI